MNQVTRGLPMRRRCHQRQIFSDPSRFTVHEPLPSALSLANENVLLLHEHSYATGHASEAAIRDCYRAAGSHDLVIIQVPAAEVPLSVAVDTYLFNSQLVTLPTGGMALLCPMECREHATTSRWLDRLIADENPVSLCIPWRAGHARDS